MPFEGWPPEAITWFEGLEEDNSRTYFTATREVYEGAVRAPLQALVAELTAEFGGEPHFFRPYRDVRFSPDKSPYKTQASAAIGDPDGGSRVYYVEISADGLMAGSGYHQMSRDQLTRYREAVADQRPGEDLERVVAGLEDGGYRIFGATLKTAPRGYPRDHPRVRLLRHKGLAVMADLPPGRALSSRQALEHVAGTWRAAEPLNRWLETHVGPPSDLEEGPRR